MEDNNRDRNLPPEDLVKMDGQTWVPTISNKKMIQIIGQLPPREKRTLFGVGVGSIYVHYLATARTRGDHF